MRSPPLVAAGAILAERHPGAEVMFVAGSVMRGEGTATSDLDLVVVYAHLPAAYRESLRHDDWPVELFVHDPETLRYFMEVHDRPGGVPALARMVADGVALPATSPTAGSLRARARAVLDAGPPSLTDAQLCMRRYGLTDLLDDLRGAVAAAAPPPELVAIGARLHDQSADFWFRAAGVWSATGKTIPRQMRRRDPAFADRFDAAFEALFRRGEITATVALVEELLAPHGGPLFEAFRLDAPADWRVRDP